MSQKTNSDTNNDDQVIRWGLPARRTSNIKLILRVAKALAALPSSTMRSVADVLGHMAYCLYRKDRRLALKNVRTFYPNASASMQRRIVVRSFQHMMRSAFDLIPLATEKAAPRPALTIRHVERLDAALDKRRGVVLITAHYGNPEVLALALRGKCTYPAFLYNPTRFGWMIDQFRQYRKTVLLRDSGFQPLESSPRGVRKASRLLKHGSIVVMAADLTWSSGFIPVSFLNRSFRMSRVPASLSIRTRAVLLPIITIRDPTGGYDIVVGEPIQPAASVSRCDAERIMTETFAHILEHYVDSAPEQWCWLQLADQS